LALPTLLLPIPSIKMGRLMQKLIRSLSIQSIIVSPTLLLP
jgi:hypothetical protein